MVHTREGRPICDLNERRTVMLRRFLLPGVGALALLVVLGAPGQVHAQRMRGGGPRMVMPGFRSGFMPGSRGMFFEPRFNHGFFDPRFNRMFFDPRFNRGFFNPRFNRMFFAPRFSPGFGTPFFRPF